MSDAPNTPAPAREPQAPSDPLTRFFGGPPLWVLAKLAMLSVVIGVIFAALNIDVLWIFYNLQELFYSLFGNIWDALDTVLRWFLLGAVIVFPIWLISRLMKSGKR